MNTFNETQIRQIYSLTKNITFQSFTEWISESLLAKRESSDRLTDFGDMKKSQGYRCALDDILSELDNLKSEIEGQKEN